MTTRAWIIAAVCLVALIIFGSAQCAARRDGVLEERIHVADSTARAKSAAAASANERAEAEHARAELQRARADSLERTAAAARTTLQAAGAQYDSSRAHLDVKALPDSVRHVLEDADAMRLAVTPAVSADVATIAAKNATIASLELTILKKDTTITDLTSALAARDNQVRALEQLKAPRCGWRCGAVITAVVAVLVPHVRDIADVVAPLFPHHSAGVPRP